MAVSSQLCSEASSNGGNASCALQLTCLACDCADKILSKTWRVTMSGSLPSFSISARQ